MKFVKKWLAITALSLLALSSSSLFSQSQQTQTNSSSQQTSSSTTQKPSSGTQQNADQKTTKTHTYTNSSGQRVQSPTKSSSVPAEATAQCRDGSYSFSQNHRGTCSHHGGVAKWLK
jgi:hypothetical protein